MLIDGTGFRDVIVNVSNADQHLDIAVGQLLGDFDLVEVPGGVVVDGGPEQGAEIADVPVGRRLGTGPEVGQFLLHLWREVGIETVFDHHLAGDGLQIDMQG